ncbi:hypothetical protein BDF22DRAFT_672115 [Syncephalis plumigaleata]|nr:hypothetical protein BDF22DRAFT_672115 [Syncephalis plumigaleata]
MPSINYTSSADIGWKYDAKQLWNSIPLNPSGERNIYDFYMEASDDLSMQRTRLASTQKQFMMLILASYMFTRNFLITIKMLVALPRNFSCWCCLVSSSLESVMIFDGDISCRILIWSVSFSISISHFCNSMVLLRKAYLILCRQKWVLYLGIPLMVPQLCYGTFIMTLAYISLDDDSACVMHYPAFIPWYWFGAVASINFLFSFIFCRIAYKQYRTFGSDAWRRLARDGIQTMCFAVLCNITCCFFIITRIGGNYSDILFPLDWAIVTTLLVTHCRNLRDVTEISNKPKTDYILHLSAIATARSIHHPHHPHPHHHSLQHNNYTCNCY